MIENMFRKYVEIIERREKKKEGKRRHATQKKGMYVQNSHKYKIQKQRRYNRYKSKM